MSDQSNNPSNSVSNNPPQISLSGDEAVYTFGGEYEGSYEDEGINWAEYGIDFGVCSVHNISPDQMVALACCIVDHLYLNGHRFELRETGEQDQRVRLVKINR